MSLLNDILEKFLKLVFPERCISCDKVLGDLNAFGLCDKCESDAVFLDGKNRCRICSRPIADGEILCKDCMVAKRPFSYNVSACVYSGSIKEAITDFKFRDHPEKYRSFGEIIISELKTAEFLEKVDVIVPVPLHEKRYFERGYNQSGLIAKYICEKLELPYTEELIKVKDIKPQSSIKVSSERIENVKGAFKVRDKKAFRDKYVLIIDDIFTTGATLGEASRVILSAGAKAVFTATIAVTGCKALEKDSFPDNDDNFLEQNN